MHRVLTCPGHFWRFDLATGERTDLPEGSQGRAGELLHNRSPRTRAGFREAT
jgi:nitrite reductase/ring-hydroxylating ferredoxin subunit